MTAAITVGSLVLIWLAARRARRIESRRRQRWMTRCQAQQIVEYTEGRQWER